MALTWPATYVTEQQVADYIAGRYQLPVYLTALVRDACRLIDRATLQRAFGEWADPLPDPLTDEQTAIREAVCAQVEYWLELGEEQSVAAQREGVQLGALQIPTPSRLAPKANDALNAVGLLYRGIPSVGWT